MSVQQRNKALVWKLWQSLNHEQRARVETLSLAYAATCYIKQLQDAGMQISMASVGEPSENAYAERVIRTIKEEEVYLSDYQNMAQAREEIAHFIDVVYQHKRIHSALSYFTPAEFEAQRQQNTP